MDFSDKFGSVQMMPSWPRGQTNVHRHHLELQPSVAACLPWLGTGTSWITILKHLLGVAIFEFHWTRCDIFLLGHQIPEDTIHSCIGSCLQQLTTEGARAKGRDASEPRGRGRFFSDTFGFYLHNHGRKYTNQLELPEVGASSSYFLPIEILPIDKHLLSSLWRGTFLIGTLLEHSFY